MKKEISSPLIVSSIIERLKTSKSSHTGLSYHKNDDTQEECKIIQVTQKEQVNDLIVDEEVQIEAIKKRLLNKTKSTNRVSIENDSLSNSYKRSETYSLGFNESSKDNENHQKTAQNEPKIIPESQNSFIIPSYQSLVLQHKFKIALTIGFLAYFLINSMFFTGFVTGSIASILIFQIYDKIDKLHRNNQLKDDTMSQKKILIQEKDDKNFDGIYKTWMNELQENYSPETYFLNKTITVYVTLNETNLRVQKTSTSNDISKRALPNENLALKEALEQRIYDLSGSSISIIPDGLVRKRYWSKKYPICIKQAKLLSGTKVSKDLTEDSIILFARSDREKEHWFNLLRKASLNKLNQPVVRQESIKEGQKIQIEKSLFLINTFLIRIFQDFYTHEQWQDKIKQKIQNKINTIKVPYFIEDILITDLSLGNCIPFIEDASEPWQDSQGLWSHINIDYSGGFKMTLSTKINLLSLKKHELSLSSSSRRLSRPRHIGITNSDEEDSPEETDDESCIQSPSIEIQNEVKNKKFIHYVNKITSSSYFQKVTDNKYIRNVMENVSNTHLMLTVEVNQIKGILALNIPPHPSDRLWYGFISEPVLSLTITPQVGEKEFSYNIVSDWLSDKLKNEFQKIFVYPNMDDFYIPLLKDEVSI